jgi:uncharacterized membrane protein
VVIHYTTFVGTAHNHKANKKANTKQAVITVIVVKKVVIHYTTFVGTVQGYLFIKDNNLPTDVARTKTVLTSSLLLLSSLLLEDTIRGGNVSLLKCNALVMAETATMALSDMVVRQK